MQSNAFSNDLGMSDWSVHESSENDLDNILEVINYIPYIYNNFILMNEILYYIK